MDKGRERRHAVGGWKMGLLVRYLLGSCGIVAALMAWWYPAPVLVRLELVDWGKLYEKRYTPPEQVWGAMEAARAMISSISEPLPLIEFIAGSVKGHVTASKEDSWADVLEAVQEEAVSGGNGAAFFRPDQRPFSELDKAMRYVEWRGSQGTVHFAYRFMEARELESEQVPAGIHYPMRRYWAVMFPLVLFSVYFGFFVRGAVGKVAASSAGKGVRISAVLAAGFSGMILWPFVYGTVGSAYSFASIFMGGFFFLGSLAAVWLFGLQASMAAAMIENGRYLARFTYGPDEWARFKKWDSEEDAAEKRSLWLVVFVLSLLIGGGFMLVMRDRASVYVFCFLMAFVGLLWVIAIGVPRLRGGTKDQSPGEVYVGEKGAYVDGMVHSWNLPGARFESAELRNEPQPHILLVYSQLQTAGRSLFFFRNYLAVRIPVAVGMEGEARALVQRLRSVKEPDNG